MITAFRRYLDTWPVRAFFVVMVGSFVFWGVGDVVRLIGTSTWVIKAAGKTIEGQAFQAEFQRALGQATRDLPAGQEPTAALKLQVAQKTIDRMVGEAGISDVMRQMHIVVPDASVATYVRSMPAFKGKDGQFDRQQFESVLRNNGMNEPLFLQTVRASLAERQLLGALAAGAAPTAAQVSAIYAGVFEKRSADMVQFPFAAVPRAADPGDATLRRVYDNHPDVYSTPEYRRIQAVILSPQSLASEITITDADLHGAYERAHAIYVTPGKRSVQIVTANDETTAKALADAWRDAAKTPGDWAAMDAIAKAKGGATVDFTDALVGELPDTKLADAVFAAAKGDIVGPIKGDWNWYSLRVTAVTASTEKPFDEVKAELRERVLSEKATDIIYSRANTLDNLLANGSTLDNLPGDLGLTAVAGTLDSEGKTLDGEPAPLPNPEELRKAIITAAFQTRPGEPAHLTETQTPMGAAYYALVVEDITPPAPRPYDTVRARVLADWGFDQVRRTQEQAAAAMMSAVNDGRLFTDAATIAGVRPHISPQVSRGQTDPAMPVELHRVLFGLKKGEATMVETADGFIVAMAAEIIEPDPKADEAGFTKTRRDIANSIANDLVNTFQEAVRLRAHPTINQTNFDQIVHP